MKCLVPVGLVQLEEGWQGPAVISPLMASPSLSKTRRSTPLAVHLGPLFAFYCPLAQEDFENCFQADLLVDRRLDFAAEDPAPMKIGVDQLHFRLKDASESRSDEQPGLGVIFVDWRLSRVARRGECRYPNPP